MPEVQYYCCECKEPCDVTWTDEGIGAYEYWGATGVDVRWEASSDCCDAEVTEDDPRPEEDEDE